MWAVRALGGVVIWLMVVALALCMCVNAIRAWPWVVHFTWKLGAVNCTTEGAQRYCGDGRVSTCKDGMYRRCE